MFIVILRRIEMNFEGELLKIGKIFSDNFEKAYSCIQASDKTLVLENFYALYSKWYYSSFFNENVLTPAHIIYRLNENSDNGDYYVPIAALRDKDDFRGFDFEILNYTVDKHPIVQDLKTFADLSGIINITEKGIVYDEGIDKVLQHITIKDLKYLEYLLHIGEKLDIFEKMPSIYVGVYRITNDYYYFFENDSRYCFEEIVEAAIELSCEMINGFFPDGQCFFSYGYIESIIKNPIQVDDFFKKFYCSVGLDAEDIWQYEKEYEQGEPSEIANAVLSSAYFLRIIIDKCFITPFSVYLKLIMPIHIYSYNFSEKMNAIINAGRVPGGINFSEAVYYPCSKYYATPVAFSYFGIERQDDEYAEIFKKYSIESMIDTFIVDVKNAGH